MEYKDYYKIMGVAKNATQDEIKRAHRKLARKYHPDVSKEVDAEDKFKEVGEAYEVLKDPQKRAAYDQMGSHWEHGQKFTPPPNWNASFEFSSSDNSGFSKFFESLFGRASASKFNHSSRNEPLYPHSQDRYFKLLIDLEDAYSGVTQSISLQIPETTADGHVRNRTRVLKVKIPKGVIAGQQIRLAGQGGVNQGHKGDLFLEIVFRPHPYFYLEGRDVYLKLPTTPWEAALGATIKVSTLGGKVEVKIPANSQSGDKLRLKARGLPGTNPGNQYVILKVVIPSAETVEQKTFYENMAKIFPMNPRSGIGD